ncbi:hypothetical protein ACWKW1_16765 [Brevibacillus parabrevis]
MKRIACLHAHHSNIALLADAFAAFDVELVPFVDPGILLQSTGAVALAVEQAHAKLARPFAVDESRKRSIIFSLPVLA